MRRPASGAWVSILSGEKKIAPETPEDAQSFKRLLFGRERQADQKLTMRIMTAPFAGRAPTGRRKATRPEISGEWQDWQLKNARKTGENRRVYGNRSYIGPAKLSLLQFITRLFCEERPPHPSCRNYRKRTGRVPPEYQGRGKKVSSVALSRSVGRGA